MQKYSVDFQHTVEKTFQVDAQSEDEAVELAMKKLQNCEAPDNEDIFGCHVSNVTEV